MTADGSSTVLPITAAAAEDFHRLSGTSVSVWISGTGGGFKRFCTGQTDVSSASRPIKPNEAELCRTNGVEYIELPVAYDGLAIVVNPKNNWATSITTAELQRIWRPEAEGQLTRWSQIRAGWPDQAIRLYGPGVDSGTYDYFTQAIVGKEDSSRKDYTSSEDDKVLVEGVANDELALGYFGYAYFEDNKARLTLLAVDDEDPSNSVGPIAPSVATVSNATYQPLSRPLFIYVAKNSLSRGETLAFASYYVDRASEVASRVGYIPLPAAAYALARARIDKRRTGSVFDGKGSQVGVSVEDLLRAERQQAD